MSHMLAHLDAPPTTESIRSETPKRNKPVKLFAVIGVVWLALITYAWTQWVVQGDVGPAPTGPTPLPRWMAVSLTLWQIVFVVIFLATGWHFLVKPLLRERRLTSDGVLFLTMPSLWFLLDPQQNYIRTTVNFNSHVVNVGCPQCHIFGWINPHAERFPEPVVGALIYGGPIFLGIVACGWVMGKCRARWPQLTPMGLIGIAVAFMCVADLLMEMVWVLTGFYTYSGVISQFTLLHGHFYQWPLYEPFMWGPTWATWACIRYFRNDRDQTIVEQGVDRLRGGARARGGVRILASVGMVNTVMFVLFTIPNQWVALLVNSYPQDVQDRSYFTNEMCGPGTDVGCPGRTTPIPVGDNGIRLGPNQQVVVPTDR